MQDLETPHGMMGSRRLTSILVVDICGYSALSEEDDQRAIDVSDFIHDMFLEIVEANNGRLFNRIADGFLAEFISASDSINAAIIFLVALKNYNQSQTKTDQIHTRLGLHVGEVRDQEDGNLLGHGVNVAVRLQENSDIDTVLASRNIINLVGPADNFHLQKMGEINLKNIAAPVIAYTVTPQRLKGLKRLIPRFTRYRKFLMAGLALSTLVVLIAFVTWRTSDESISANDVLNAYFAENTSGSAELNYSQDYLRYVLENLQRSNVDSERATFELLKSGNISGAIERLEYQRRRLLTDIRNPLSFDSDRHIEYLHQLAALSYHHDPHKAQSYYKAILFSRPDDARALLWLARAQRLQGKSAAAASVIAHINDEDILNPDDLFQLKMDRGFNQILDHKFEDGLASLEALEDRAAQLNNARLVLEWKTHKAIALERLGRLAEAELIVSDVINDLNEIGPDTNMPRAYNIWGQIYEQRAFATTPPNNALLRTALEKYSQQYRYGESLNKESELAEALHYMGAIHIALGENEQAKQKYSMGVLQADDVGLIRSSLRSQIGLAHLQMQEGSLAEACNMQTSITQIIEQKHIPLRHRNQFLYTQLIATCRESISND